MVSNKRWILILYDHVKQAISALLLLFMKIITITIVLLCLACAQEPQQIIYEEQHLEPLPNPPPQAVPEPPLSSPSPLPEVRPAFKLDVNTLKLYQYEVLGLAAVLFYLLAYIRGKKANVKLMEKFYRKVNQCLEANFAHIGFTKTSGEAPFNGQSPSESTYYATGRDNVEGIEMKFSTKKRQDVLYSLMDIFLPEKDTVTIDIPVKADTPLVLAVLQRKLIKEYTEKHLDVRTVTRQFKVTNMHTNYEVLGQAADTVDSILDKHVVKKISDLNGLIFSIHYTDLKIFSESTGHLRVVLNLAHKNEDNFLPGIELALYLVDKIANFKISANSRTKALKSRESYNQSKEKEDMEKHKEDLKKKKEQKLRQEEAWIRSLPPEKQKREEEKRKKKQFNKMMKGKTMKMM